MNNPNRVYDLASFLQALSYNFAEWEGEPIQEDDPPARLVPWLRIFRVA